jgi:hypothetical protein
VSTEDDPYAERKKITFEEAERAAPSQLKLKEISQQLRATLWAIIYGHLEGEKKYQKMSGAPYFTKPWSDILRYMHVYRHHAMADEFENDADELIAQVKEIFVLRCSVWMAPISIASKHLSKQSCWPSRQSTSERACCVSSS